MREEAIRLQRHLRAAKVRLQDAFAALEKNRDSLPVLDPILDEMKRQSAQEVIDALAPVIPAIPDIEPLIQELTRIEAALMRANHGQTQETVNVGIAVQELTQLREILGEISEMLQCVWEFGLMDSREDGSFLHQAVSNIEGAEIMIPQCRSLSRQLSLLLGSVYEMIPGWQSSDAGTTEPCSA